MTIALFALAGGLGLIIGSFLNVVIFRGPTAWGLVDGASRGGLAAPRSYCPACKAPIPAWRLLPLLSFALQRGRCAACGVPISWRYPVIEALGAVVAIAAVANFGVSLTALAAAIFGWALIALAAIDFETGYLPDAITLPLVAAGVIANSASLFVPLIDALIGAVAGFAAFWAVGRLFEIVRGKEGLGWGDYKLIAGIGAFVGWKILPSVVFIAALATLLVVLAARLAGKDARLDHPIPFGPGLCFAGFVGLFFAEKFLTAL